MYVCNFLKKCCSTTAYPQSQFFFSRPQLLTEMMLYCANAYPHFCKQLLKCGTAIVDLPNVNSALLQLLADICGGFLHIIQPEL
jgi:hypothetical protein